MSDPTEKCLAIAEFRMRHLRLFHGATDETSDDSVPLGSCDAFRADVQYNREFIDRWFENACKSFGSVAGDWAGVPDDRQADALAYFGYMIAQHENMCEFELDLFKIEQEEKAEALFDKEIA